MANEYYLTSDIHSAFKVDMMGSTFKAIRFLDGPQTYKVTKPEAYHTLIFEIFKVKPNGSEIGKISPVGISFLPMF